MKLFAPKYYKDFSCIADRCKHSCCIGWEIDIGGKTAEKYAACQGSYAENIRASVAWEGEPHFKLGEGERCPHLNEKGLCRIIIELGEDYLCHICREHPRFYNDTARGREVGLGMACEEACRIILSSDDYDTMYAVDEVEGEICEAEFDTLVHRKRLYGILRDKSLQYAEKLQVITEEYSIAIDALPTTAWRALFCELEYLDEAHKTLFADFSLNVTPDSKNEKMLERALAYFIYRHCAEAWDLYEFRISLGFCLVCERLLASLAASGEDLFDLARIVSEEIEYSEDNTERITEEFLFI